MNQENTYSQSLEIQLNELLNENLSLVVHRENTSFDELTKPFGNRIVLFGAGGLGRKTLSGLRKIGIDPLAFTDNNSRLWNTFVDGLQVLSPQDAAGQFGKTATFITTIWHGNSQDRQATRLKQLIDLNCVNIISFGHLFWKYPSIFFPHAYLELPSKFRQHTEELRKLFYIWADDASRQEYISQLKFRMRMEFDSLTPPASHAQYFPKDLFSVLPEEVFIDCGAFDGDTIQVFLQHQVNFSGEIFAFEPDSLNFQKLQKYISTLSETIKKQLFVQQSPVGTCGQKVRFSSTGTVSSAATENGDIEMDCICIDQMATKCNPSFIKMDIEGAEVDALKGARETIQRLRPILAICVYHKPNDLWEIPLLISSYFDDYRLFLRPHDEEGWELVCYAIPPERLLTNNRRE